MMFKDIPGLSEAKKKLVSSVRNNHVAHAQLFSGKPGSANLSLALAFSTYLNCENQGEDSCGECASCVKAKKYIHPDIHFVFPVCPLPIEKKEAKSAAFIKEWREFLHLNPYGNDEDWSNFFGAENKQLNISKEESRQIIRDLSLKSFEGKYKVMIIWLAEYLHPSAANGILKILEEPPENTIFLLVTYDREQLITTILSRTQVFHVPSFSDDEISAYLQDSHQLDEKRANQLALLSGGNLNLATKLITEVEDDSHQLFRDWMRVCYEKKHPTLVDWTDKFFTMNKVSQKSMIQYGINMLRESLISQNQVIDLQKVINADEQDFVSKFGGTLRDHHKIERFYGELNTFLYHIERNINVKIAFLDTSLKIHTIFRS